PSSESNAELFLMLFKAIIAELAIPVHRFSVAGIIALGVEFSLLIFIISKYRKSIIKSLKLSKIPVLSSSFFIVGFTYLLSVIIFRWFIKFDQFAFRLLSPGTFMISVGLFFYIINICSSKGKKIFIYFLLFFSISSLILFVPVRTFIKHNKSNYTYNETKNKILKKYNNIEPNSIVVFGPYQLTYLRSDLKYYSPQYKESWSKFIGRLKIKNKKNIYVSIPKDIDSDFLDISTINFLKSHKSDKLIKL
ncbi:hypothetical protein N9600_06120, partial [Flavobacteriaceae bacterium]|nr:hypothetical protein [Flavobacteriaceae bacterium]